MDPTEAVRDALAQGKRAAMVEVTELVGSPPSRRGQRLAVIEDGTAHGTLGCDGFDRSGAADALRAIRSGQPATGRYDWDEASRIAVSVTPYAAGTAVGAGADAAELLVVGSGPVARALVGLGRGLGFRVRVAVGPGDAAQEDFSLADEVAPAPDARAIDTGNVGPNTFVVICGHDEAFSQPVLRRLMRSRAPYLGMMGSRRHTGDLLEALRAEGFTDEEVRRVHSPVGLDIRAETPEEIALSALAQIVSIRRTQPPPGGR
jgi:xanthine dehydrogenase accessory factor